MPGGVKATTVEKRLVMKGMSETSTISYQDLLKALFSGRKIVEILKKNPTKDPAEYDEKDIPHMRKVVAYCKRHLAQEGTAKKNPESKSAKSLKNWGHDPQRA